MRLMKRGKGVVAVPEERLPALTAEQVRETLERVRRRPVRNVAIKARNSKTDWPRVTGMKHRDIKLTREHPELDLKHVTRMIVRSGLKPVSARTKAKKALRNAQATSAAPGHSQPQKSPRRRR